MNILFPTISRINDVNSSGIYLDLLHEFGSHGHEVYIVSPIERKFNEREQLIDDDHIHILRVKILNMQKTNVVEKGLSMLTIERRYLRAIKKYLGGIKFDLILFPTPPITFSGLVKRIKIRDNAKAYLLLKDIFPQNAVDLGMFSRKSFFYRYFRGKEKELYRIADYIGCMSPANVRYVLDHNKEIAPQKVELCPNSIKLHKENKLLKVDERNAIRRKYAVPTDKIVFIYGGNLGKPQGLHFMPKVLESNEKRNDVFFLIVGDGTEYGMLKKWFDTYQPANAKLLQGLPKEDYDILVGSCDVGLIFLDRRFTIPNYPSRLLSYLQNRMPVLCAVDKNTDIGTIAVENGYGYECENGNLYDFDAIVDEMCSSQKISFMGEKGYEFLCANYTVEQGYETIIKHFV